MEEDTLQSLTSDDAVQPMSSPVKENSPSNFIRRPSTPPNILNVDNPPFAVKINSPMNKSLNDLVLEHQLPPKPLDLCTGSVDTATPVPSSPFVVRRRNISTCPMFRTKFSKLRCVRNDVSVPPRTMNVQEAILEYINPFTPDGKLLALKRAQLDNPNDNSLEMILGCAFQKGGENYERYMRRARLSEMNVERFHKEFVQVQKIGAGVHGSVYKCLNRMNGCIYAVKKSNKEIDSGASERIVRNEVYAHAILDHPNLVKNYSSWTENGFVYIQNEYCNAGTLSGLTHTFTETEVCDLLYQISLGLRYIHEKGLAHMDIKPENIMLHNNDKTNDIMRNYNHKMSMFVPCSFGQNMTYKLGDFGHVVAFGELSVEDGDCRYLSNEIIQDNYAHLDRADIFALGLTIYETISRIPLPKNGEKWQLIRKGKLNYLPDYSPELNALLVAMVTPEPTARPTAREVCERLDELNKIRNGSELVSCLQNINNSINFLQNKIDLATDKVKAASPLGGDKQVKSSRLVGKKTKRSTSTTLF